MKILFTPKRLKFAALRGTCPVPIRRQKTELQNKTETEPKMVEPSAKIAIRKSAEINHTSSIACTYILSFSIYLFSPTTPGSTSLFHMTQRRSSIFNNGLKLQFGLSVVTSSPAGKTNCVTCRFCDLFGREKNGLVLKKQSELSTIQSFKPPFRREKFALT